MYLALFDEIKKYVMWHPNWMCAIFAHMLYDAGCIINETSAGILLFSLFARDCYDTITFLRQLKNGQAKITFY